jgi:hypothetical protein
MARFHLLLLSEGLHGYGNKRTKELLPSSLSCQALIPSSLRLCQEMAMAKAKKRKKEALGHSCHCAHFA